MRSASVTRHAFYGAAMSAGILGAWLRRSVNGQREVSRKRATTRCDERSIFGNPLMADRAFGDEHSHGVTLVVGNSES